MTIYKDQLSAVLKTLKPRKQWIKGDYAKDAEGFVVEARSPSAVCWCLEGAAMRAGISTNSGTLEKLMRIRDDAYIFNDAKRRTHKQVLDKVRLAIKRAPVRP